MPKSPQEIVALMMDHDGFSQWLQIAIQSIDKGQVVLKLSITKDMLNGFGIAHGGISYSLADSALAFASNSHGRKAYSIETSISHLQMVATGDTLIATAKEVHRSYKTGLYEVKIVNQDDVLVAVFKGTVYVSSEEW